MNIKLKKKLKIILISIVIIISVLGYIGIKHIAPYAIIQPMRRSLALTPADFGLRSSDFDLKTTDSVNIRGIWVNTETDSVRGIMILVHGIGDCKESFLALAKNLAERGIESVIFDGRAHGKSGGQYCTYGFKEKEDVSLIVDMIKNKAPNLSIGIWGHSLGGAIALQALERDKRIEFGIVQSTFTQLDQVVLDYKKRFLYGIGIKSISDVVLKEAGRVADFNPDLVKPIKSVANIEQPVFIGHGDADENISVKYGEALYDNLKSKEKQFFRVKGGGHNNLIDKGGVEYSDAIMAFVEKNLNS